MSPHPGCLPRSQRRHRTLVGRCHCRISPRATASTTASIRTCSAAFCGDVLASAGAVAGGCSPPGGAIRRERALRPRRARPALLRGAFGRAQPSAQPCHVRAHPRRPVVAPALSRLPRLGPPARGARARRHRRRPAGGWRHPRRYEAVSGPVCRRQPSGVARTGHTAHTPTVRSMSGPAWPRPSRRKRRPSPTIRREPDETD
jgi:hypothetical protein